MTLSISSRKRQLLAGAVLTELDVAKIKRRLIQGESPRSIAGDYDLGVESIRKINRGDSWKWVEPADELGNLPGMPSEAELAERGKAFAARMVAEGLAEPAKSFETSNPLVEPAVMTKFLEQANAKLLDQGRADRLLGLLTDDSQLEDDKNDIDSAKDSL